MDSNACNDESFTLLDLSLFSHLKVLEVGDYSFAYVDETKLIGLAELERVVIGRYCFAKEKSTLSKSNPNRHFYLRDCPLVKTLEIGGGSFCDYSVCEIENNDSLEVIEMEQSNMENYIFHSASLKLKSDSQRRKCRIDLPELKSVLFNHSFTECPSLVLESNSMKRRVMNRLAPAHYTHLQNHVAYS